MGRIEDVFLRVKERVPGAFSDSFPPNPPSFWDGNAEAKPDLSGGSTPVGNKPGFDDPSRADEEIDLEEPSDISERLKESGWEAIAWYLPFHLNEKEWGIYIDWIRLKQLASHIGRKTGVPSIEALRAVYDEIIAHELFHCRTEIFTTIAEDLRLAPFYRPYNEVYRKIVLTDDCIEEALATSYGLSQVKNKQVRKELEQLSDKMPGGYKHWRAYPYSAASIASGQWWEGIDRLTQQIIQYKAAHIWSQSAHSVSNELLREIPTYIWLTVADAKTVSGDCLRYLVRTRDFIECLRKIRPDLNVRLVNKKRGRHPSKLSINGRLIPYKPSWDGVPPFIFNQVAEAMGMKGSELRDRMRTYLA